mgnify:CR=1 FL=1
MTMNTEENGDGPVNQMDSVEINMAEMIELKK